MAIKIHNKGKADGFGYCVYNPGSRYHQSHSITLLDMVSKSGMNLFDSDIEILNSKNNVTVPNTLIQRVLMDHSNKYVT